jgi:magnesium transporter
MIKRFALADGSAVPTEDANSPVQLYIAPDQAEREALKTTYHVDEHTVASTVDPDEVSRIEVTPDYQLLIWKRPTNYSSGDSFSFDVRSMGMLLLKDRLVVVASDELPLREPSMRPGRSLRTPRDVLLEILYETVKHYLGHLKVIKLIARDLQRKINLSMENRHLIQMFNLSESLVYYINAISSNGTVLSRLKAQAERDGAGADVVAFMDDLIIENEQCLRQAQIYSTVFSGLMDARGNLVNNNMNVLLKNLTIINVVFLPLNLLASIGGMSEFSVMTHGIAWPVAYGAFCIAMVVIGWGTAVVLRRTTLSRSRPEKQLAGLT